MRNEHLGTTILGFLAGSISMRIVTGYIDVYLLVSLICLIFSIISRLERYK